MNLLDMIFGKSNIDFADLFERGAVIIDVRSVQEFKAGHGQKAINIPLQEINSRIEEVRAYGKPVIACCRSGNRSGSAANTLKSAGIEAYNGGSWQHVDRELAKV